MALVLVLRITGGPSPNHKEVLLKIVGIPGDYGPS